MTIVPPQAAEIIRAFRSLSKSMRVVRGLIDSHVFLDAEEPRSLCYIEEWKTADDIGQEAVVEHFTRVFGLMEKSVEPPVVRVNFISNTEGLKQLSAILRAGCSSKGGALERQAGNKESDRTIDGELS